MDNRHHFTEEETGFIMQSVEALLSTDNTTIKDAIVVVTGEFNARFQQTLPQEKILSKYYFTRQKINKTVQETKIELDNNPPFIARVPGVTGNGYTFKYPKDEHEIQAILEDIASVYSKIPDGVAIYRRVSLKYKMEVTIEGVADKTVK